ncbi:MAG: dipeptidase [Gemmatimonadota bacterium]|nr:dipeptidase [Gemmatimonadota bacterium]
MTWEHLHLIAHSFPIVMCVSGTLVGLFGWARDRPELETWALVALVIAAAFVAPAYLTGLAAADVVADRIFVRPGIVQTHRFAATWAAIPVFTAGALAAFALHERDDTRLRRFVLIVGLLASAAVAYAAWLGSKIQHGDAANPTTPDAGAGPASAEQRPPTEEGDVTEAPLDPARVHVAAIVVDGHNDLPWRIRGLWDLDLEPFAFDERHDDGHTDIPRLREGGVDVQFWAAYVPVRFTGADAVRVAREQIDLIRRLVDRYPADLELALTRADVERIVGEGKIASMIGVEGGHAIDGSLEVLRELYDSGVRYMTLTHSATLDWVDAAGDTPRSGGLSDYGREVIAEMNRLGMMVDISHVTADAMRDVLDATSAPVIFSHSSARALADHPRNVPDDVLARMATNGGVVMVNFFSGFLTPHGARNVVNLFQEEARIRAEYPDPAAFAAAMDAWYHERISSRGTVATIADHIDHIVSVAGVDHVGLGSDFDGVPMLPEGMEDVSKLPALTVELVGRGYSEEEIAKILGGNLLRVLGEVEARSAELRAG